MPEATGKKLTQLNQSTEKALNIIELLAKKHVPMRLQDISKEFNINVIAGRNMRKIRRFSECNPAPKAGSFWATRRLSKAGSDTSGSTRNALLYRRMTAHTGPPPR